MDSLVHKSEIKLEELCRTCLSKEMELFSLFDASPGSTALDGVIAAITGIKIEAGDGLPTTVCGACRERALSAYEFKTRSQQADEALRGLLTANSADDVLEGALFETSAVKTEQFSGYSPNHSLDLEYNLPLTKEEPLIDFVTGEESGAVAEGGASCPACGAAAADAAALARHVWDHHAHLLGPRKRGRPKHLLTGAILRKLTEGGCGDGDGGGGDGGGGARVACPVCRAWALSPHYLALHMDKHKDDKLLCCVQCKKMYLKQSDFELHPCTPSRDQEEVAGEGEVHLQAQALEQGEGKPALYATEMPLQELMLQATDPECGVHVCGACGRVLRSAAALAAHRDADHPDLSLRCPHCHKVFLSLRGAARHRGQCAQVERAHACGTCGARFAHAITLNKHILRHHAGQPVRPAPAAAAAPATAAAAAPSAAAAPHRCDTCRRTFRRKELLQRHAKLHKPGEKCLECNVCNKKYHRKNNLQAHIRTHETRAASGGGGAGAAAGAGGGGGGSARACLCLYCGRGFSNSSNLIVHMRRHTGEKPYKCDFCGKGFPRSTDLQYHRRSHTGEKPCVCGVCGKGFTGSNKLSRHMRVHTGLKPYKCTYCERAFSQSNDLTLHVRRHTGDKPYVCDMCGDRFIQGTALHNHKRAHGHYPAAAYPAHTAPPHPPHPSHPPHPPE